MNKLRFLIRYLQYILTAKHAKGFGVHSPFLYKFATDVLFDLTPYYAQDQVWNIRQDMLESKDIITITDLGSGSIRTKSNIRKISDIAKYSAISEKHGEMLFRLVVFFKPQTILELGTSLGIGTSYLALPNSKSNVWTIEGCAETAKIAKNNFNSQKIENIKLIIGNFDDKLSEILNTVPKFDLIFFDGNHKKDATINYFEKCITKIENETIFIFDDIHLSNEMLEAWSYIKKNEKVRLTVDLFFMGIVFFRKELSKENFIIKF